MRIRRGQGLLAFAAPPLRRSGPVEEAFVHRIAGVLRLDRSAILAAQWVDNGPGWVAVLLGSANEVLAVRPGYVDFDLGLVGPYPPGAPAAFELRAFFPKDGSTVEDPVTGSLERIGGASGWSVPAWRPRPMWPVREPRWAGSAGCTSAPARTVRSGSASGAITCVTGHVDI